VRRPESKRQLKLIIEQPGVKAVSAKPMAENPGAKNKKSNSQAAKNITEIVKNVRYMAT